MNKETIRELSITGILVLVLFFAVQNAVRRTGRVKRAARLKAAAALLKEEGLYKKGPSSVEASLGGGYAVLEKKSKDWKLRKDPFTGADIVAQEGNVSIIVLSGIFWDAQRPMAILNDAVVTIGDTADGYVVTDIRQDKVILRRGLKSLELRWN